MADFVFDVLVLVLIGIWLLGIPIIIYLLRDRLAILQFIFMNKILPLEIYRLKNPEQSISGSIEWKDLEQVGEWKVWKIKKKGILSLFANTGRFKGFALDSQIWAHKINNGNDSAIRLLQIVPNIHEKSNYYPLDLPQDMGIDGGSYKAQLSEISYEINKHADNELGKLLKPDMWQTLGLPAIMAILIIVTLYLSYLHIQTLNEQTTTGLMGATGQLKIAIDKAYNITYPEVNATQKIQDAQPLPFQLN